jgi:hypothetical protein
MSIELPGRDPLPQFFKVQLLLARVTSFIDDECVGYVVVFHSIGMASDS